MRLPVNSVLLPALATPAGLALPDDLPFEDWKAIGEQLDRAERTVMWAIGEWWLFGERRYGARKATVTSPDWKGPSYATCREAARVARAFPPEQRQAGLTFKHHQVAEIGRAHV